jgi:capsular exopolysaccharide synthesis family protein
MEQDLERQVDAAKSTYEILLKRLQEVRIAENQNVGNAQIISPAMVSEYPVSTSRKMILALGIVLGGVFYVVTAFLLELIDPSIKTSKELRKILNYTLLAMIPNTQRKRRFRRRKIEDKLPQVAVIKNPTSMIGESYRMLQANLNFLSPDRKLQVIVVTSSVTKEGKSTVAANLAAAMAELGNRVLLMDADLRHPIQHHIWNLTNAKGLSDAIVGQLQPHQVARPVAPNLDVLPSGVIPPNSLALLSSKRMNSLVQDCREAYDCVILDTPPLLLVADALTVSKMSDGILLVARPGLIDSASANAAKQRLDQSGQTVLGIAMNGVVGETEPDSYFHYAEIYYKENSHENIDGGRKKMSEERKKSISH